MMLYLVPFGVALVVSVVVTPFIRNFAVKLKIVDSPDRHRKLHERPTALGGGLAVLSAFVVAIGVVFATSDSQFAVLVADTRFVVGMLVSALTISLVGLLDDRFRLRGRQKLFGQVLAVGILIPSGVAIGTIRLFGVELELGILTIPFTLFWVLGAINALNLLDGVDGLATSIGIVLSLAIAFMAILSGHPTEAFMALAMAGALFGFLIYNSPPASIFLGDTGSMLIGLVLGTLAIRSAIKGPATVALAAPAAVWAIPIFDVLIAIMRRRLTGRSIYTTDRGHLHHSLLQRGYSGRKTVVLIGTLCCVTAVAAVVSVYMHNEFMAIGAVLAVFAMLIISRFFGYHEFTLLARKLKSFGQSLVPSMRNNPELRQFCTRLRGQRQWEDLWDTLTGFAERFDLCSIQLNVMVPAIGEEFHATWQRKDHHEDGQLWHSDIPLLVGETMAGRLRITGAGHYGSVCSWMGDIIAGLKPFETQLIELLAADIDSNVHTDTLVETDNENLIDSLHSASSVVGT